MRETPGKLGGPGRIIVREKRPAVSLCVSNSTLQTKRDTLFNRKKPPRQRPRYLFLSEIRNPLDNNETRQKKKNLL